MKVGLAGSQRRYARVPCGQAARVESVHGELDGSCENLSLGGAFFTTPHGSELPGQQVDLLVDLPARGPTRIPGQVRRVQKVHGGVGLGISFTRLTPLQLDLLNRLVAQAA